MLPCKAWGRKRSRHPWLGRHHCGALQGAFISGECGKGPPSLPCRQRSLYLGAMRRRAAITEVLCQGLWGWGNWLKSPCDKKVLFSPPRRWHPHPAATTKTPGTPRRTHGGDSPATTTEKLYSNLPHPWRPNKGRSKATTMILAGTPFRAGGRQCGPHLQRAGGYRRRLYGCRLCQPKNTEAANSPLEVQEPAGSWRLFRPFLAVQKGPRAGARNTPFSPLGKAQGAGARNVPFPRLEKGADPALPSREKEATASY